MPFSSEDLQIFKNLPDALELLQQVEQLHENNPTCLNRIVKHDATVALLVDIMNLPADERRVRLLAWASEIVPFIVHEHVLS